MFGVDLALVITAELPALLALSFTRTGTTRSRTLITLITDWTRTLTSPDTPTEKPTTQGTDHSRNGRRRHGPRAARPATPTGVEVGAG